jgi:predicted metalloprotease
VYLDLSFFKELETRFGAKGGPFARAYVIAHEYGHHIQSLLGTSERVRPGESGPMSGSVRLELQADCYAGVWANHAESTPTSSGKPLITDVTKEDVAAALDTAERIGDDFIQSNLGGGRVDESQFTHGSSAQREKWYRTGLQSGDPARCDTFARGVNLG